MRRSLRWLFPIRDGSLELGRGDGSTAAPADPRMSRRHATVSYDGERFLSADHGSQNGSYLDGQEPAGDRRHIPPTRPGVGEVRVQLGAGSCNAADQHPAAPEGVTDPELRKAYIDARAWVAALLVRSDSRLRPRSKPLPERQRQICESTGARARVLRGSRRSSRYRRYHCRPHTS